MIFDGIQFKFIKLSISMLSLIGCFHHPRFNFYDNSLKTNIAKSL